MNAPLWVNNFPRLSDLYLDSNRDHPNNYFELKNVSAALLTQPPETYYIELEQILNLMDSEDWKEFKKKTKPYITAKDQWGWHTQIVERFHEARGYAFLKQQGFSKVHFIPEKQNQKTPDLRGTRNQGVALLEAKRIRDSDEERDYLTMPIEQKDMRKVAHTLPEPFKEKLKATVQMAKTQLYGYDVTDTCRRILFLSIRLDLLCATNETKQQLDQFLSSFGADIEIVHRVENDFFL